MVTLKTLLTSLLKSFHVTSTLLKKMYQKQKKSVCLQSFRTQEQYLWELRINYKNHLKVFYIVASQKCQTRFFKSFRFKDSIPKDLISGVVHNFKCGLCNESCDEKGIRHLDIRPGESIGESPLTGSNVNQLITVLFVIIYFIVIIHLLPTTLAFRSIRT